jgi:deoxyribose-phosphate aldolase
MIDFTKITKKNFGKCFDHTCLAKYRTEKDIRKAAREAVRYNVACFGTSTSYWLPVVIEELAGTDILPGVGIDFPFGMSCPEVKAFDTEFAVKNGARCIDFVMNIAALQDGKYDVVHEECRLIKEICGDILTKGIIDVCFLKNDDIVTACKILAEEGIGYAKSSSGQYNGPSLEQVRLMHKTLEGCSTKVKVAGVKFPKPQNAIAYMLAGAELIGTQDAPMIIDALDEMRAIGMIPQYQG